MLVALLGILTLIGSPFGITLWDWAQLLIIPAVLASGGIFFNQSQQERDRQSADRRAQDDALEAYLDDMTDLMINYHLRSPPQGEDEDSEDVRDVARARTLTVLARLDGARKAHVVQFLFDSGLIHKGKPAVDLSGADLREADLRTVFLSGANLRGTHLSKAHLSRDLFGADLSNADLREADLSNANLSEADLSYADLRGADLKNAWLYSPAMQAADSESAADLSSANLSDTDLRHAEVGEGQLDKAITLSGAIMPDGSKHP